MITQLDTENADRDLTGLITVLTHTPDAGNAMICQGLVMLGDGVDDLDGTGGTFELVITVDGQTVQPSPQEVAFGTEIRSAVWTTVFPVPANKEVILRVKSPNAGDNNVDVIAYLYDVSAHPSFVQNNIDHLCAVVTAGADMTGEVVDNTILSRVLAAGNTSDFVPATHSLETITVDIATNKAELDGLQGADGKAVISTDVQDLSATLSVNTKLIEGGDATDAMQASADAALVANKLDHLIAVADGDDPVDDSIIAMLAAKAATADWSDFVNTTDSLEAIRDAIGGLGGLVGSGADTVTLTINDGGGLPIGSTEVWISTDAAGLVVVAGTLTANDAGEVVFQLDAGSTYYRWAKKVGYNFTNPSVFVAVAD